MFFLPEPGLRPRLAGVRIRFARHWATSACVGGQEKKEKEEGQERRKGRRQKEEKEKDWEGGLMSAGAYERHKAARRSVKLPYIVCPILCRISHPEFWLKTRLIR